jgi:hypothetical protein
MKYDAGQWSDPAFRTYNPHITYYRGVPGVVVIDFSFRGRAAATKPSGKRSWRAAISSVESDRGSRNALLHPNKAEPGCSIRLRRVRLAILRDLMQRFSGLLTGSRANGPAATGAARDDLGSIRAGRRSLCIDAR